MGYNYVVHALCLFLLCSCLQPAAWKTNTHGHTLGMAEHPVEGAQVPEDRTDGFHLRFPVQKVNFYPV